MDINPIRLTVDTMEDFRLVQEIYRSVGEMQWIWIYDYLQNKHDLNRRMVKNILENEK
jgi:spore coat polysaccharide biosynthesis protein SpsF (cytidylyltransferase family)